MKRYIIDEPELVKLLETKIAYDVIGGWRRNLVNPLILTDQVLRCLETYQEYDEENKKGI